VVDAVNSAVKAAEPTDVVLPSREDPVVNSASAGLGGPAGRRIRTGWTRAIAVALMVTAVVCSFGLISKQPCRATAWNSGSVYPDLCYSDVAYMYRLRGDLAEAGSPYSISSGRQALEYPVLSGGMMYVAAVVTNVVDSSANLIDRSRTFFDITALLLVACALATTWLIARTAGRRPWDAMFFALSPGLLLTAFINWDLFAVMLTAGFGLAWARRRPVLAGTLLGLAIAAKFYPVVLLGPLLLLCLRAGKMKAFTQSALAAAVIWIVVNLPVRLLWPSGWGVFYDMSRTRGEGFGSIWFALQRSGWGLPPGLLNTTASGVFGLLCVGIAILAFKAPRRPRLWQLGFLVVAAFAMTNKVYSPQYVLWMVALYPLARPRWRDFLIWQAAEVVYFVAVWWELEGIVYPSQATVPEWPHTAATVVRLAATAWVCALIVRDVLHPHDDPIRADGSDDPAGGVLDGAPDTQIAVGWLKPSTRQLDHSATY
jgi:uncharacterized membrane protein